jgi:hypothetical protein
MHTKKEVGVQISKRRCNIGSYKGEVARLHPFFSVRKEQLFVLKTLLAPPNSPLDVEIGCGNILLSIVLLF